MNDRFYFFLWTRKPKQEHILVDKVTVLKSHFLTQKTHILWQDVLHFFLPQNRKDNNKEIMLMD